MRGQLMLIKKIVIVCLCFGMIFLSGCITGGDDPAEATTTAETTIPIPTEPVTETPTTPPEPDEPPPVISALVGNWHLNADLDIGFGLYNYDVFATYNLDGTGTSRYVSGEWELSADFTWTAENGVGTSSIREGATTISTSFSYGVVGNVLTIYQDGLVMIFQRIE